MIKNGAPEDHMAGDFEEMRDALHTVRLAVRLEDRPLSAAEYLEQPAKFNAACELLAPWITRMRRTDAGA